MAQFIYSMNRVAKIVPPKRNILRDTSLSFFPGAKSGVLGLNGDGKSTLQKIYGRSGSRWASCIRSLNGIGRGICAAMSRKG